MNLICSDCGEQRIKSCSCSEFSSYRNSYSTLDVGSVGRISFLIENDKGSANGDDTKSIFSNMLKLKQSKTEDVVLLKRSNSCVVEVKKSKGFWKIGKFFKNITKKSEIDGTRSRSLSSFMDGNIDHVVSSVDCSSAKVSIFKESESRKSDLMEFENGVVVKDVNLCKMDDDSDDDEFIDLQIDLFGKLKTEYSDFEKCDTMDLVTSGGTGSSSCRFMVNERGIKKTKNNHMKAWKWIFKHHSGKKDMNHILKS
ncbi:hypothetical protein Tco_1328008 [Tanacetum coccineum]